MSFNGKMRFKKSFPLSESVDKIKESILADPQTEKYLAGANAKKVIIVPSKIINIVY